MSEYKVRVHLTVQKSWTTLWETDFACELPTPEGTDPGDIGKGLQFAKAVMDRGVEHALGEFEPWKVAQEIGEKEAHDKILAEATKAAQKTDGNYFTMQGERDKVQTQLESLQCAWDKLTELVNETDLMTVAGLQEQAQQIIKEASDGDPGSEPRSTDSDGSDPF